MRFQRVGLTAARRLGGHPRRERAAPRELTDARAQTWTADEQPAVQLLPHIIDEVRCRVERARDLLDQWLEALVEAFDRARHAVQTRARQEELLGLRRIGRSIHQITRGEIVQPGRFGQTQARPTAGCARE